MQYSLSTRLVLVVLYSHRAFTIKWPSPILKMFLVYSHYKKRQDLEPLLKQVKEGLECTENIEHSELDGIFVLGGDGTLLSMVSQRSGRLPTIYAFNCGSYGFLTPFQSEQVAEVVAKIKNGFQFEIIKRAMLEVTGQGHALNEVFITRCNYGKLNRFGIRINGHDIGDVRCDAILLSTVSGSSAYNYSCGGPILSNSCDSFVLNIINPCLLNCKPIVLGRPDNVSIVVLDNLHDNAKPLCVIDGHKYISDMYELSIRMSCNPASFASFEPQEKRFSQDVNRLYNLT